MKKRDDHRDGRKRLTSVKTVAVLGVLVAAAFVLSYIEMILPISVGIPGVKLGLCHIVTLFALYRLGPKAAWFICFVRLALNTLLFGNAMVLIYSAAGAVLSLGVMLLLYRRPLFSHVGVSLAGGVGHNIGQILCAALMMETAGLIWYLPVLLLSGTVSGAIVGILGGLLIGRFERMERL